MTDPIADLLTQIRNAGLRRIASINVPHSKMKEQIVQILRDEHFITDYSVTTDEVTGFKYLHIVLRYTKTRMAIEKLKRVSKPGIRRYVSYDKIPTVRGGIGICVVSTSKGVMTGRRAKEEKVGGELLCTIY